MGFEIGNLVKQMLDRDLTSCKLEEAKDGEDLFDLSAWKSLVRNRIAQFLLQSMSLERDSAAVEGTPLPEIHTWSDIGGKQCQEDRYTVLSHANELLSCETQTSDTILAIFDGHKGCFASEFAARHVRCSCS